MRLRIASGILWTAVVLLQPHAFAQQPGAPEPIVQVTAAPSRVVVGQPVTLRVLVLAPNYMTSPPELPDFQFRNAVTRQLRSLNTSEQRDGVSYAGVRFEYAITPQEPGSYATADQTAHIKYAADPPATREVAVALPRVSFDAFIPDAAVRLLADTKGRSPTAEQEIKRSSDQLKAGDAVTRTVTIRAEGTPAMLLPPRQFAAIDGLQLYPAQPVLEDKTQARTDVMTATRTDSATYMLERPGDYSLPAIEIDWWNTASGKIERIQLDAVAIKVAAVAGANRGGPGTGWTWESLIDLVAVHWLPVTFLLVGLAALAWIAPAVARRLTREMRRRRAAYLVSEAWSFRQFRRAARHGSAGAIYFALLGWLQRFEPLGTAKTVDALTAATGDRGLDQQINALRRELFAPRGEASGWSRRGLMRHVMAARRVLRRRSRQRGSVRALPQQINPLDARGDSVGKRKVAR